MISVQTTIQKILNTSDTYYEIPNFQRPYSWTPDNAKIFLDDLEESIQKKQNHYFGTVVLVDDADEDYCGNEYSVTVIDGQQRITTALLMVAAIYHLSKENSALLSDPDTTPTLVCNRYLFNANLDKNKVKLRTVTTDNRILQRIFDVDGDMDRLDQHDAQSNLYQVYAFFRHYFSKQQNLDPYINGLKRLEVVSITLNSKDDNPQRVFESINYTGKPLTDGDKIRNFALMLNKSSLRQRVYEKYWSRIEESLVNSNKDFITDFFRSYIISKLGTVIKLDSVYSEFKNLFAKHVGPTQEQLDIDEFYSNIIQSLEFYKLLKIINLNDGSKASSFIRSGLSIKGDPLNYQDVAKVIFKMRYLQIDIYIPFALNILQHYANGKLSSTEVTEAFKIIEIYFSRRIVCGIEVTSVDHFLATLHRDILKFMDESPGAEYTEVMKYILLNRIGQTRIPDAAEYENSIRTREIYYQRNAFLVYILSSPSQVSKESVDILPQIASKELNLSIEHIMPQTLSSKEWQDTLGPDYARIHQQYLHTLANLTLTGYNSEYSNRSYLEKMNLKTKDRKTGEIKEVGFVYSPLPINKWIAEHQTWNEDTLIERQKWWVSELEKNWPLPTTTFKPSNQNLEINFLEATDLKGREVRLVKLLGYQKPVETWAEALSFIVNTLYERDSNLIKEAVTDDTMSKNLSFNSEQFLHSAEIFGADIFINTATSTNAKLNFVKLLAEKFNLGPEDIKVELKKN